MTRDAPRRLWREYLAIAAVYVASIVTAAFAGARFLDPESNAATPASAGAAAREPAAVSEAAAVESATKVTGNGKD